MAIAEQSRIKRYPENFKKNSFLHNDANRYVFKCWNTERDGSGLSYDDEQITILRDDITLYAIWREREKLTRYENFTIEADNVTYDKTSTEIRWSVTEIQYYEGTNDIISKIELTGIDTSDSFSMNGVPYSEDATTARKLTIRYTSKEYHNKNDNGEVVDIVAETVITLYGYTPIYYVDVLTIEDRYDVICKDSAGKTIAGTVIENGRLRFCSTSKNMTFQSKVQSLYNFVCWKGIGVEGLTTEKVQVAGLTVDYNVISVKTTIKPLMQNSVIGKFRKTWSIITYSAKQAQCYLSYNEVHAMLDACAINGWRVTDYNDTGQGWAPWYVAYQIRHVTKFKNEYAPTKVYSAPYTFNIPTKGIFRIKGKYGVKIYGCDYKTTGGFVIAKNGTRMKMFKSYHDNSDIEFEYCMVVNKNDKVTINAPFSTNNDCVSIFVDVAEINECQINEITPNNYYSKCCDVEEIDNNVLKINNAIKNNKYVNKSEIILEKITRTKNNRSSIIKTTTNLIIEYTTVGQKFLKVGIFGALNYNYTRLLTVIDKQTNDIIYNSCSNTYEPISRYCYLYLTANSNIIIKVDISNIDIFLLDTYVFIHEIDLNDVISQK